MVNILPVAPHGTTDQMSPDHAAVPIGQRSDRQARLDRAGVPGVGVAGDEVAAGAIRGDVQVRRSVEIEHALTVEVDEREALTTVVMLVAIDPHTEAGTFVERDRLSDRGDGECRGGRHPDTAEEPLEAVAAQLDVLPPSARRPRLGLAATRTVHRRAAGARTSRPRQQQSGWFSQGPTITPRSTRQPQSAQVISI